MSLRSRLIAGLLAVSTVGLLVLAAVTYAEQRSFLLKRVDDQLSTAPPAMSFALSRRGVDVPGYGLEDGVLNLLNSGSPPGRGAGGGAGGYGGRPPRPVDRDLPYGTYGQRRDASGKALGHVVFVYGQSAPSPPRLPAKLQRGRAVTVDAVSGGGHYRVEADSDGEQPGTVVVAIPLRDVDQTLDRLLVVEGIVIAAVLVALAAVAYLLVRIGLRPLDRIGATAGAIAAGDLSRRVEPAGPRTEVGRLGLALNAMLERLERAFAEREDSERRLRQFLADASHELRTPLVSIRGYAELFRMGAASSPEDTAKAMGRIESEAARMGVLVEDLLGLARLDAVREDVRERVDLGALAADAIDDARASAPGRPVDLRVSGAPTVCADPDQLRQVLSNLLRNAEVHTPVGTRTEVSVRATEERVRLEVRDHGPGIPGDDPDAVFERFWRSEGGRKRGRDGAGLGLAIVAAIVAAHDGTVHAVNAADGGACFVVELPAVT